jgi:DNA-binding transcriptional LysR family regulator
MTTQRLVDFTREDIDVAIRFGTGKWPGVKSERMFGEVLTPLCGRRFVDECKSPADLHKLPLIRSTEEDEWPIWFAAAGVATTEVRRGPIFDSTKIAVQAAIDGLGIVMGPPTLFADDIAAGRLFQPFALAVETGKSYWFVVPENSAGRPKVKAFRDWIFSEVIRPEPER